MVEGYVGQKLLVVGQWEIVGHGSYGRGSYGSKITSPQSRTTIAARWVKWVVGYINDQLSP